MKTSNSENLHVVSVADGDPVRLEGRPLYLVDLSLGSVGQDRYLDRLRHWLNVPDQSLVIVSWVGVSVCVCVCEGVNE